MAVSTSVKMRAPDKARLDRLQAQLTARGGRKLTQEELLARLVTLGDRNQDQLLGAPEPGSAAQMARLMRLPVRTGRRTREEDIERDLYGEPA